MYYKAYYNDGLGRYLIGKANLIDTIALTFMKTKKKERKKEN